MASHGAQPVHGPTPQSFIPVGMESSIGRKFEMSKVYPIISPSVAQRTEYTKPKPTSIVKRSKSTSSIDTSMDELDAEGSSADRRRNRLGYHRTSVACGHCRRRKIRCLLAPGDPQGRCGNCIRLRRACQFFPVDQQPSTGDGNRGDGSPVDAEASTSSSPIHPAAGPMVEHVEGYPHLQPHPLQTGHDFSALNPFSASTLSSSGRTPASGASFDYPPGFNESPSWDATAFANQSPDGSSMGRRQGEDISGGLWRVNSSPMTGANPSQFPVASPSAMSYGSGGVPAGYHPAPGRSMSVASPHELPAQYQARFLQQSSMAGQLPTSPGMGNPSSFRHPSMDAGMSGAYAGAAMTAPPQPGLSHQPMGLGFGPWTDEQGRPQMPITNAEGTTSWYPVSPTPHDPNNPYYQRRPGHPNQPPNPP